MNCKVILRRPLFINNRIKPTWPQFFWRPGQHSIKNNDAPIPPAGEVEMRQHLGVRGKAPAGVQRAAPFGAPRIGVGSGAKPPRESRGQRPLVPAAEAASPARGVALSGALSRFAAGEGVQ